MSSHYQLRNTRNRAGRRGATAITILLLLGLMFVALAFSIDLARVQLAQLELQCATDTACRAGAEALSRGVGSIEDLDEYQANVEAEIAMVAALNRAGGVPLAIDSATQVEFGDATENPNVPGALTFSPSASGGDLEAASNSVNVTPNMEQFPMVFSSVFGLSEVDLGETASAIVQDRDIVLVLDRTTSMTQPDAGLISKSDYPTNLKYTEDLLYRYYDPINRGALDRFGDFRVEFVSSGDNWVLTRMQALKLAVLRFRQEIDASRGLERLGVVTYNRYGNTPSEAANGGQVSDGNAFDITSPSYFSGNPWSWRDRRTGSEAFQRIIGMSPNSPRFGNATQVTHWGDGYFADGRTDTEILQGWVGLAHEKYASAMEEASTGYPNFDHTYLAMRYGAATHITRGMEAGEGVLFGSGQREFATPIMIVMTDGKENSGSDAAATATEMMGRHPNMRIYTITFGDEDSDEIDIELMRTVANTGRGDHFHASDVTDLVDVFQELARSAGVGLIE